MTDHHAEYEAAARRKSADAMVADVRHMRDQHLAVLVAFGIWLAWPPLPEDAGEALDHLVKAEALDELLAKWETE